MNNKMRCICSQRNISSFSYPPLSPLQLPSPKETHLWYVVPDQVKSETLLNRYMEVLSPDEKQHVLSMRGDHLQKPALLARALVRTTIARYQVNRCIDPGSLKFWKNIHGKPEVEWPSDGSWNPLALQFNISHTSSLIACGVTLNSSIGIDIEEKLRKTKNNVLAFAKRYFTRPEIERLSCISDSEILRLEFIKLWTLKEAFVKALGKGFSAAPFKTFTVHMKTAPYGHNSDLTKESEITVEYADDPDNFTGNWRFALIELAGSHFAAICVENNNTPEVGESVPLKLTVRRTIPFVEDECVSGTDLVIPIGGFIQQKRFL